MKTGEENEVKIGHAAADGTVHDVFGELVRIDLGEPGCDALQRRTCFLLGGHRQGPFPP